MFVCLFFHLSHFCVCLLRFVMLFWFVYGICFFFGLSLVLIITWSSAWEGASLPWTVGVVNTPYMPRTPLVCC